MEVFKNSSILMSGMRKPAPQTDYPFFVHTTTPRSCDTLRAGNYSAFLYTISQNISNFNIF